MRSKMKDIKNEKLNSVRKCGSGTLETFSKGLVIPERCWKFSPHHTPLWKT